MGNFLELENRYSLIYNCQDGASVLSRVSELLRLPDLKVEWMRRREPLLREKIDLTTFMIWLIESYPKSFVEMKEHPGGWHPRAYAPESAS
jgi:predicted glycosyltransferase